MLKTAIAAILLAVSGFVLLANTLGGVTFEGGARLSFCLLCVVGLLSSTIRERFLLAVAILLAAFLIRMHGGWENLLIGLDLAAYFAAFIVLLTALKIAAERSRSVLAVGRYLIQQPTGRRFFATASGGHILGVFLNFGAVSLMAPLIQSATKHLDGTTDEALERRQLSALMRGFAWILLWAPTTLSQAVLLTIFTEISLAQIVVIGLPVSILMMLIGYAYDRYEWRNAQPSLIESEVAAPKHALVKLGVICTALIGTTALLQVYAGFSTALSLMFVAPAITFIWFVLQRPVGDTLAKQLSRFWPVLELSASGLARSAMALGLSGFIGRALADVLPIDDLDSYLDLAAVPGWAFLAVLPILITLGGQVAISPIVLVVFIGQVVQSFPILPADPANILFALSAGWAISMFASPNATATLLASATTGIAPTVLTWRWNLRYAMICYVVLVAIFVLLEV